MRSFFLLVLVANIGCLRTTEFKCQTADQCGTGAACETNGYCSFPDSMCSSGRRYGEFSGSLSSKCVGDEMQMVDSGGMGDVPMGDVPISGCPAAYVTLSGAGTHRYKALSPAGTWAMQRDACAMDGANAYLAIPDNQAELQALSAAIAATRIWVGINDMMTEGSYVTVKGAAATYLPWDTANNEPDNGGGMGGQDCVTALMASPNIATDACDTMFLAVCECEP